ncbi:hypothetical protein [Pantoea agglomerans]|uniref:hypothetical protein n=1 Tax=Enterobacter agglomerans TaxID=549 RepID=UPI0013BB103B|nr:hypothetical protein [Pantoea agglomerans]NEG59931.1 hypothetical protein [Pantoea agglomerans]NEH00919.1 hypothetical protein [Pantoea agglomerans]NEH05094.1 hypothetical protein [Pantoea agglomerans]NEH16040.1 hypothetical protein [Pantoea agglomerans]
MKGTMSITFTGNSQGEVMFSGNAVKYEDLDKVYFFERLMQFSFSKIDRTNYQIGNVLMTKYNTDDLDDDAFSKYIYSAKIGRSDYLIIMKVNNGFLMGNMVGPRHLCVKR